MSLTTTREIVNAVLALETERDQLERKVAELQAEIEAMRSKVENDDRLMSPQTLAALIDVSPGALSQWRLKGGGPRFIKQGKFIRYSLHGLREWAAANTIERIEQREETP